MVKREKPSIQDSDDDEENGQHNTQLRPSPFCRAQLATSKRPRNGPPRIARQSSGVDGTENEPANPGHSPNENQPTPNPSAPLTAAKHIQLPASTGAGTIKLVKVHNFMTYKDAEIRPGPRLNLVLGPNGTGKSSLVCALCVGLGGGLKLLGRADKLNEFIRRGQNEGWTEITLAGDGGKDHVIRREMRLTGTRSPDDKEKVDSTWRINGVVRAQKDVAELMQRFNIQLDNLCQFLPQDKVVEFARLNPAELLQETEKAIGDATLYLQHQDLIVKRNAYKQEQLTYNKRKEGLDKLRDAHQQQERDYERFRQRTNLKKQIEEIEGKLLFLEYAARKEAHRDSKAAHDEAKMKLEKLQPKKGDTAAPVRKLLAEAERARAEAKKHQDNFKRIEKETRNAADRLATKDTDLDAKVNERNGLAKAADDRLAKIANARQLVQQLKEKLETMPEKLPAEQEARLEELREKLELGSNQMQDVDAQLQELETALQHNAQSLNSNRVRLQQIGDAKAQKINSLGKHGLRQAYDWVCANRHRFRGPVHGPVLLDVTVRNPQAAVFLEMSVPQFLWSAFVVTCREDDNLLTEHLKSVKCNVSTYCVDPNDPPVSYRYGPASDYARFGIVSTLDEEVSGPREVMQALNSTAGLNNRYMGTAQTDSMMEELTAKRLPNVYTPKCHYSLTVSRYDSNSVSTSVNPIRPGRGYLSGSQQQQAQASNVEGLQRTIAALEQTRADLERDRIAQLDRQDLLGREQDEMRQEQMRIQEARRKITESRKNCQRSIECAQVKLSTQERTCDPRDREPEIKSDIMVILGEMVALVNSMAAGYRQQCKAFQDGVPFELRVKEAEMQAAAHEAAVKAQQQQIRALQEEVRKLDQAQAKHHAAYQASMEKLQLHLGLAKLSIPKDVQQAWGELPEEEDRLQELIQQKTAQIASIVINNPGVAKEYEDRARAMAALSGELDDEATALASKRAQIDSIKAEWLPQLLAITEKINETFSANFCQIGCAGEVVLKQAEGEDFANYAMEIRVKFRESEALQVLNAQRQSGGERSVSTILYLIALQDVTVTPFRVVDEINQGMDPVNERKVFNLLVGASCRDGTPQCFLLTPKLLPDLPFTSSITVLNIFNGSQIEDAATRQVGKVALYGKRLQLQGGGQEVLG